MRSGKVGRRTGEWAGQRSSGGGGSGLATRGSEMEEIWRVDGRGDGEGAFQEGRRLIVQAIMSMQNKVSAAVP